jgi:hypothetical protein
MSRNLCVIAAILFICRPCFAQAPASEMQASSIVNPNSSVKLEDSTSVTLRTKQDLSSAKAKVGDRVPFRVAKDVTVADLIVIPRGQMRGASSLRFSIKGTRDGLETWMS